MSWEGYNQVLCPNGHPYTDYADSYNEPLNICPNCKTPGGEFNTVDQTNGCMNWCASHDEGKCPGEICEFFRCQCGMKKLILVTPAVTETCSLGYAHIKEPAKYRFGRVHVSK